MKSPNLLKWTVAKKLWLAFGLLLSILLITILVFYWQNQRIDKDILQFVEVQEPLGQSILKMQTAVGNTSHVVSDYVRDREQADVLKLRDSEATFDKAIVDFKKLTQTDEAERLGQEVAKRYGEFKRSGYEIVALVDRQYTAIQQFRKDIKGTNNLIGGIVQATIDTTSHDNIKKLEAALGMAGSLDRVSKAVEAYVAEPNPAMKQEVLEAQADFERFGVMYRGTGVSAYEDRWLGNVQGRLKEAVSEGMGIIAVTDNLHTLIGQFELSLSQIDAYFDSQIRPLVQARAGSLSAEARASTTSAVKSLLILGVLGVLVGGASAWFLSRKITNPVRDLVEGAKAVSNGKLEHRFCIDAEGEFGQLGFALNKMLDSIARSREALAESDEMGWSILDASSDVIMLVDARGVILASNQAAARRFGKSLEQIIDMSLYDLLPSDLAISRKAQIAEVIHSKKPIHFEDERGSMIFDQIIYPVLNEKGDVSRIAIFASDITMRKWVEEVAEQVGRRHELILEAAGEGIYGLDTQGKTIFVNPAAARMLGYKPEELIGQRHHELVHHSKPDGKRYPHEQCPIYAAFRDGTVHNSVDSEVFWRKDGTSFPVEYTSTPIIDNNRIVGAVVTFQDITDRRQVEKALHRSEENYRSMFECAANLILSVDKEGIIVDCNAQIQQILGYAPNSIIGQPLAEIVHPAQRMKVEEWLKEVLTKGFEYGKEYKMVQKDGTLIDVNINAAAVRDADGQYIRTICMIGDITKRV